jgi:hypothetical protein
MARLTNWEQITSPTDRVVAILADSTGELDAGGTGQPWPRLLREKMQRHWGISGTGLLGTWRDEWAFTAGGDAWTESANTDTWSKGPYVGGLPFANTMRATTATMVATWTKPIWVTQPITSFKIYVVDGVSSANFSYRIDGGAWTDVSHTWNQDDSFDIITIPSAVTSTVEIRGGNAVGLNVTMYLTGIECITGTGATLHDLSASAEGLYSTARSGNVADLNAWIDVVQPDVLIVSYTNDFSLTFYNTTRIQLDLQSIVDREAPYGYTVPMFFWGQNRGVNEPTPAQLAAVESIYNAAASPNSEYIDLFARYGDYTTVNALGYMADTLHPSDKGSMEIAKVVWSLINRGTGNVRIRTA